MKRLILAAMVALALPAATPRAWAEHGRITPRFREHYDLSLLKTPAGDTTYGGLSSSVNLHYEVPMEWSFGLVFNPVLPGRDDQLGDVNAALPAKVRIWRYGVEYQRFLWTQDKRGVFARLGAAFEVLDIKGVPNRYGGSYYIGLGWEQRIGGVGIAPEVAFRHSVFENDIQALAFTPSLALRLYFINEWLEGL